MDCALYFAFKISPDYQSLLDQIPFPILSLWIQPGNDDYLQQIELNGERFLGKKIDSMIDVSLLENHATHLVSLLERLVPDYQYEKNSMILLGLTP